MVFGVVILLFSAVTNVENTLNTVTSTMDKDTLSTTLKDAHLALRSIRHVTDKLDTGKVLKEWHHTNQIIQENKIPWKELPQWRLFAQHSMKSIFTEIEKNPNMIADIKETSKNILHSVHPLMVESKEWRKSLRSALYSTAKTILNNVNEQK